MANNNSLNENGIYDGNAYAKNRLLWWRNTRPTEHSLHVVSTPLYLRYPGLNSDQEFNRRLACFRYLSRQMPQKCLKTGHDTLTTYNDNYQLFEWFTLHLTIWRCVTYSGEKWSSPATRHGGALGERRYCSYTFLTSALEGGEWSASRPGRALPLGKEPPVTHCTGGWVGPRAGLDAEVRGKILCLCRGLNSIHPVRSQKLYWLSYPALHSSEINVKQESIIVED
jgi:hypothetical protein